tara:strand:- start:564 stop:800 length:237 start_codon:yes stop_codon:yes gene_type:complete
VIFKLEAEIFYYFCTLHLSSEQIASVAELVDALDSKSSSFGSVGSIPTRGTIRFFLKKKKRFFSKIKLQSFVGTSKKY